MVHPVSYERTNGESIVKSNEGDVQMSEKKPEVDTAEVIRFAFADASLGRVLAARSERGVCAVLLGADRGALLEDLGNRFPSAELVEDPFDAGTVAAEVAAFIEHPIRDLDLPLDLRGTPFQQCVWTALRAIPAGTTASYTEIAATIGHPESVRAVAGACGANAVAVIVPCHRALRADGSLSGYRWGLARKKSLLEREARTHGTSQYADDLFSIMPESSRKEG